MRLEVAIVCAVLATGCMAERELPTVHAQRTAGHEPAPAPSDPVRADLRELHRRCADRRDMLSAQLEDAKRRQRRVAGVAAAAAIAGELADGPDGVPLPIGREPCTSSENPDAPPTAPHACPPGAFFMLNAEHPASPDVQRTVDTHLDASEEIRDINRAIDAADEFLFSHPDSDAWSEAQRERWRRLRDDLDRACGGS